MNEFLIQCIGGVLFGLSHPSNIDEFIYSDLNSTPRYTKNNSQSDIFVTEGIEQKFAEQLALHLI
ncbi:hypothetical protein [Acinetobacter sp. MD2(2019)]|uniref:hypothetical protein n=1 Tax=Acinetobacter sp. MD2(2019) TaxID=2605273 RepID=UPI002D1E60F3|nr:hypothetical protein [Acinetobacter sp. MD2(2019)]MEB3755202.1 hypothetical protein [Acinetobacter sp. MD2(2019)]